MNGLVSVIITTHKRSSDILKRAIDSVFHQTYLNYEVIVVDDAPDYIEHDQIVSLIDTYSSNKLLYIINDRKSGACASRNIGINQSSGEYIALLDDDDSWENCKLAKMVSEFSDESIGLVYANQDIYENGEIIKVKRQYTKYEGNVVTQLLYGNFIGGCSVPVFRRVCVENVGSFDEEMPAAQDIDLWIRIAKEYKVKYVDEALVNYYVTEGAITSSPDRRISGWRKLLKKYDQDFNSEPKAKDRLQNLIVILLCTYGRWGEAYQYYKSTYMHLNRIKYLKIWIKGFMRFILRNMKIVNR